MTSPAAVAAVDTAERSLLSLRDINLDFGGVHALSAISAEIPLNKVTAIIGPNGAGKTSLFNVISGFYKPSSGDVVFDGQSLISRPASDRAGMRIARTFQNLALFSGLSVLENIKLGAHAQLKTGVVGAGIYFGGARREEAELTAEIEKNILGFLRLESVAHEPASGLPYGIQKRVELARALIMRPRMLMLDEPVAGMNSSEKQTMAGYIRRAAVEWGATVLLIEHDMEMVMRISDKVIVLNFGKKIAEGTPDEVRRNPDVIEAYLGVK